MSCVVVLLWLCGLFRFRQGFLPLFRYAIGLLFGLLVLFVGDRVYDSFQYDRLLFGGDGNDLRLFCHLFAVDCPAFRLLCLFVRFLLDLVEGFVIQEYFFFKGTVSFCSNEQH